MNRKRLGLSFGIGVLLCGLGCGIAFAQYSQFSYAGEKIIGEENIISETAEQEIDNNSDIRVYPSGRYYTAKVVADESVPIDKIFFDVSYNSDSISFSINKVERDKNESWDEPRTEFYLGSYYGYSEAEEFFSVKDEILKDLKNDKLGSYRIIDFEDVIVRVNPENYNRVEIY